jgi:hypothetical protein
MKNKARGNVSRVVIFIASPLFLLKRHLSGEQTLLIDAQAADRQQQDCGSI